MRARLVRPTFWRDEVIADLPPHARLTYIGTWGIADDAGYLDWKPREIGAELYPHMSPAKRDRQVLADLERLVKAGRIAVLECGHHAFIPTLVKHGVMGGTKAEKTKRDHDADVLERMRRATSGNIPETPGTSRGGHLRELPGDSRSDSPSDSESGSDSPSRRGANGSIDPERPRPKRLSELMPDVDMGTTR